MKKLFPLLFLLSFAGCKKDDPNTVDVSYEKLSEVKSGLVGFTRKGNPLGLTDQRASRWNPDSKQWERLTDSVTLVGIAPLVARCEDGDGNFYETGSDYHFYTIKAGTRKWQPLVLPDVDSALYQSANFPISNSNGTVAIQTCRQTAAGLQNRIYSRSPGSDVWTLINDRPKDNLFIQDIAENGDIFLAYSESDAHVVKAGSKTLVPVADCNGSVALPYCSSSFGVAPNGAVVFYPGINSRVLYRIEANTGYPTTASELCKMPDKAAFFFSFNALSNGTIMGMANMGGYDEYFLFIRRAGASEWTKAPSVPGQGYVYVKANRLGQAYTSSNSGIVYKINF